MNIYCGSLVQCSDLTHLWPQIMVIFNYRVNHQIRTHLPTPGHSTVLVKMVKMTINVCVTVYVDSRAETMVMGDQPALGRDSGHHAPPYYDTDCSRFPHKCLLFVPLTTFWMALSMDGMRPLTE